MHDAQIRREFPSVWHTLIHSLACVGLIFAGLAFHQLDCEPSTFATGTPVRFKPGDYISDLLSLFDSAYYGQPSRFCKRLRETAGFKAKRPRFASFSVQHYCSI